MSTTDNRTIRTVIREVARRGTSRNGNPTMTVRTDHGEYVTQTDTSWAYGADNSEWRDAYVTLHLSRNGRIRWAEKVDLVELARDRYKAWHEAESLLRDTIKPALIEGTHEGGPALLCPGCNEVVATTLEGEHLRSVDVAERWTEMFISDDDSAVVGVLYDGFPDFDGVCYLTTCCFTPVDLPSGWVEYPIYC